jgi:hypothetical protein
VADGGGARPESARESGLPVAGGSGPGAGSGGEAQALKRRGLFPTDGQHRHQPERGAGGQRALRARVPGGGAADRRARGERGHGCAAARTRVGRPEKKRGRAARMHCKVLYLFELVWKV